MYTHIICSSVCIPHTLYTRAYVYRADWARRAYVLYTHIQLCIDTTHMHARVDLCYATHVPCYAYAIYICMCMCHATHCTRVPCYAWTRRRAERRRAVRQV